MRKSGGGTDLWKEKGEEAEVILTIFNYRASTARTKANSILKLPLPSPQLPAPCQGCWIWGGRVLGKAGPGGRVWKYFNVLTTSANMSLSTL